HGLVSGALFLCVGVIYDRLHTREIDRYGGLADNMPKYAVLFMVFTMAWVALACTTGIILGAAYMLYLYRRVIYGALDKPDVAAMRDLSLREVLLLVPIALAVLWMGVYPESFLAPMRSDVNSLMARVDRARPEGDA